MDGGSGDAERRVTELTDMLTRLCNNEKTLGQANTFEGIEAYVDRQIKLFDEAEVLLAKRWC